MASAKPKSKSNSKSTSKAAPVPIEHNRRRLNRKGLLIFAAVLATIAVVYFPLKAFMDGRVRSSAMEQSRLSAEKGEIDLAIRHLDRLLIDSPDYIPALESKAKLLTDASRVSEQWVPDAIKVHDRLIRLDPTSDERLENRRKLAELYIQYSDMARRQLSNSIDSIEEVKEIRYQASIAVIQELLRIEGEKTPPIEDAAAHRLLGMAYMGQIPNTTVKRTTEENIPELLRKAKTQLLEALRIDPRDLIASERLAELYLTRLNDPEAAEKTLDIILAAMPDSVEVRLSRYRAFTRSKKADRARAELDAAIALAPKNPRLRLQAASDSLVRRDTTSARRHLAALSPEDQKGDLRVKVLQGQIDFAEQSPDEAIDQWRQGLTLVSGANGELTWQLAFSMIKLGGPRLADAPPLMKQYLRLSNEDKDRKGLFLEAMFDQRMGHPSEAIEKLEKVIYAVPRDLLLDVQMTLGSCYENIGEIEKAITAYTNAANAAPLASSPRRAIARIRLAKNPDQAISELERALKRDREEKINEDAAVLFDLLRIKLRKQVQMRADRRQWEEIEDLFFRVARVKRGVVEDITYRNLYAEYLSYSNRFDAAIQLLTEALKSDDRRLPSPWLALASMYESRNRRLDAIKILDQGMASDAAGDRASLRIAKARLLLEDGRGQAAREVLSKDHSNLPASERPDLYRVMGILLSRLGDREGAKTSFLEWARLTPESTEPAQALLNLAEVYGDDEAARLGLETLRTGRGQKDPYALASQALELLRVDRNSTGSPPEERIQQAERLVAELSQIAPALYWRSLIEGRIHEYRGNLPQAADWYRRAVNVLLRGPASPRLIEVYMKQHDTRKLLALEREYEEASKQNPGLSREFDQLALQIAKKIGEKQWVEHFTARLVDAQSESVQTSTDQARLLIALGKTSEAEEKLRESVKSQPQDPTAWYTLIKFFSIQQNTAEVAKTIAQAKTIYQGDRPELFLAECYWFGDDKANATRAFEIAREKRPDDLMTLRAYVGFFMSTDQDSQVDAVLRKVLTLEPTTSWAAKTLALRISSKPDPSTWPEAWNLVKPDSSSSGDSPEDRLVRATVLARSPESARRLEAVRAFTSLVEDLPIADPLAIDARIRLSRAMLESNNNLEAWTYIAPLADDQTRPNPEALTIGIEALARVGKGEEAQKRLDQLTEQAPKLAQLPILKAWVLTAKGKPSEASEALKSAFAAAGKTAAGETLGLEAFDLLIRFGDLDSAEELARQLAAQWPRDAWKLARVHVLRKESDKALAASRTSLAVGGPLEVRESMRQAVAAALLRASDAGFLKQVEAVGQVARAKAPNDFNIFVFLATILHMQGRYEDEVASYEQALKLSPTNSEFLNNMAWTLSEGLGRHKEALNRIEETINRVGSNSDFLDTRGVIQSRLGNHREAIADLETSIKIKPLAATYFHLAQAYLKAGNPSESQRCRELAWKAGFDPETLDATDRTDLELVMGMKKP